MNLNESLTPQQRILKYHADLTKKQIRIKDLQKRMQFSQKKGNKARVKILQLDMQLAKMDIQKLQAKIKKEQLKTQV